MSGTSQTSISRSERWKLDVLLSASFLLAVDVSVLDGARPEMGRDVTIAG